jgi:hypothetical protein
MYVIAEWDSSKINTEDMLGKLNSVGLNAEFDNFIHDANENIVFYIF